MNISIVGAGKGGTNILNCFSNIDDIHINMIIDKNLQVPGIQLAKKLNIPFSQNIEDIDTKNTDVIIEATGIHELALKIDSLFGNNCSIVDSNAALLIMTLVERDANTIERMDNQISVINSTSEEVEKQLGEISASIDNIHGVSDLLLKSTNTSNEYIKESDKIIQSVNKIAQQTKILGINASIESARAGEQGKGFSIVAREVQGLAKYSEDFAGEIYNILMKISQEITKISSEVSRLEALSNIQVEASTKVNNAVKSLSDTCKMND